jgi:succinate dehydrogenase/fumarate reductase flavoprotein subunit
MKKDIVETDVLCVGGGIAGLMAAIRASEHGARVVVADKANPVRSGPQLKTAARVHEA